MNRDYHLLRAQYGDDVLDRDLQSVDDEVVLAYIAGPMRRGNLGDNVHHGLKIGMLLLKEGYTPIMPQTSHFTEAVTGPPGREDHPDGGYGWLDYDFALVSRCDVLIRIEGSSEGADREVALALALGIPVLSVEEAITEARAGFPNIQGK